MKINVARKDGNWASWNCAVFIGGYRDSVARTLTTEDKANEKDGAMCMRTRQNNPQNQWSAPYGYGLFRGDWRAQAPGSRFAAGPGRKARRGRKAGPISAGALRMQALHGERINIGANDDSIARTQHQST